MVYTKICTNKIPHYTIVWLPPYRDIALRIIPDAVQCVSNFAEFDLLLDVVFALASDYGSYGYNLSPLSSQYCIPSLCIFT